jgi:hypothetical protein
LHVDCVDERHVVTTFGEPALDEPRHANAHAVAPDGSEQDDDVEGHTR